MKFLRIVLFILFLPSIGFAQEKVSTSISNKAVSKEKNGTSNNEVKVDTVKTIVVPAFKSKEELEEYLNSKNLKTTVSPSK
jgi:hypothetical protein